ncbi:hypothetical protein ANANG_G00087910 [Anguilla anguilla]|uniref:Ig-like domain-containing protein n=1 Tax=Anguilla anguilla TaxID=7936 RepID=A0A9D3MLB0_ANGAN|nr:hypothetical protein ANANG_G00087910 [Anguilla anguilla]
MAGAKDLLLVGYLLSGALCSEFTITMPESIEALNGSCVLIPCTFSISKNEEYHLKNSAGGVWIKRIPQFARATVVFNSSQTHNILSGEIVGDLVQKNCTTVLDKITKDYTDKYFFRIETTSYMATFRATPVYIAVKGSPQKPKITKLKELNEGTQVDLKCTAAAPCNKHLPVLAWTPNLGNIGHELQENSNKIKSVLSVLTFTPSHFHHGKNITCSAEYTLQTGSKIKVADNITLNVLFPPKNTMASISPSGPLVNGSHVTLTCSSSANPPVNNFTWFRTTGSRVTKSGSGQTLTFDVSSDDVGWYYCEAQNQQGKQESGKVNLTIKDIWEPLSPAVIGAVAGTLGVLLACLLSLLFWRLRKSRESCVSIRMTSREGQGNPSFDPSKADNTRETTAVSESQHDEVQYAEISNLSAKEKGKRDKGQEIEYAEVRFPERKEKAPTEEIYETVKPKHHP